MTRERAHLARVEDASSALRTRYGRSGAWARIAQQDAQRLLDVTEPTPVEPQPPLRLAGAAADGDGGQA